MSIDDWIEEMDLALQSESNVVSGYSGLLALPDTLIDSNTKREVKEGLVWSSNRVQLLKSALDTVRKLKSDDYPNRVEQIAAQDVIEQIRDAISTLSHSLDQFDSPPEATLAFTKLD